MRINIYLSYYNGSLYIDEQIQSILRQKNVEVYIYIRDDGSKAEEAGYLTRYEGQERISITYGNNIGYGNSFLWLVQNTNDKADFYAFSDQDDVWLDSKLMLACERLGEIKEPAVYGALPIYVDDKLRESSDYCSSMDGVHYGYMSTNDALKYELFGLGCTYVWNDSMNSIIKSINFSNYCFPHDNFLSIMSPFVGTFYRDNQRVIMYRQHKSNNGGKKGKKTFIEMIRSKYKNFNDQTSYNIRSFLYREKPEIIKQDEMVLLETSVLYRSSKKHKYRLYKYLLSEKKDIKTIKNLTKVLFNKY